MKRNVLLSKAGNLLLLAVAFLSVLTGAHAQSASSTIPVPGTVERITRNQRTPIRPATSSGSITATAARLTQSYSSTGRYTLSVDGVGSASSSMNIRVNKPNAQATVQRAILISSVTSGTIANGCVTIAGSPITWTNSASVNLPLLTFTNYWADVTSLVSTQINSFPAGISTLPITECNSNIVEGEALLVVFNDPTTIEKTIVILIGAQDPNGDNFPVTLAQPINPTQAGALLDMGLGIGYSFQGNGTQQYSQVSVNGQRLSTAAGGTDDGAAANGALITVGGIGDLNSNPVNPLATPTTDRSDDELYNILPFITSSTTSLTVNTVNPSLDDNIFLAYFSLSGAAIIGEGILLSQTDSVGIAGTQHTVKASVLNTNGQPVANRSVTFTIASGPNAGNTFSTTTNSSGEAFYTYTGNGGAGTDAIQACFTNSQNQVSCSNTVFFRWTAPSVYYSKSAGNLSSLSTWGSNTDGSGVNPTDFGAGKTFVLANRSSVYTLTSNWTVGGIINNPSGSQMQINGFTLSEAGITGTGTLTGSMTSNLVVTGTASGDTGRLNFTVGAGMLSQLTINRDGVAATLGTTPLSIYDVLTISSGMLNTGNVLTLKSTATNTARVAPVTGTISGTVTVERYIPARRAWRIMSAPIAGSQTVNQAWQEGATSTTSNPVPNYGTFITGGSVADGFDQSQNASSSLKTYNSTSGWQPVPTTNTTPVNGAAYMLFGYGNRNNVTIPVSQPATNTTLRVMGPLKTGDQTFTVNPTGFTAIPNPFASPVNFATITKTGVANSFYVWDPKVGGTNGVGAYVTVSFNGSTYDISSNAVSPESQYIQSGQGFLVYPSTSGTPGSIIIKESDKSNTAATNVFRSSSTNISYGGLVFQDPAKGQGLRLSLQAVNGERTNAVLDEVFSSYKANYANRIDELDAVKPANIGENIGIEREGQTLSIERRTIPVSGDTIKLKLWNTSEKQYLLEVNPINLSTIGLYAYLKDNYLKKLTPLNLDKITQAYFTIDNAVAARSDRFSIIFSKNNKLQNVIDASSENVITAFPNPIVGRTINLQFNNQPSGAYVVTIVSNIGKIMFEKTVKYNADSPVISFDTDKKLAAGVYQVRITGKGLESACKILVQ